MPKKTPRKKPPKKSPPPFPQPLCIEVAGSRPVHEILTRTKGLLGLIRVTCEAAAGDDFEATQVFGPDLLESLQHLCLFAAQDLYLVEMYLSHDVVDCHKNQLAEMAIDGPGGAS